MEIENHTVSEELPESLRLRAPKVLAIVFHKQFCILWYEFTEVFFVRNFLSVFCRELSSLTFGGTDELQEAIRMDGMCLLPCKMRVQALGLL